MWINFEEVDWKIKNGIKDNIDKKSELLESLTQEEWTRISPFPEHEWYTKVWNGLSPELQKEMAKNIRITPNGGVEVVEMGKVFYIVAKREKDKVNNTDTYFTGQTVKKGAKKQNKEILHSVNDRAVFINSFPGESKEEKMRNIITLFDIKPVEIPFKKPWSEENKEKRWLVGLGLPYQFRDKVWWATITGVRLHCIKYNDKKIKEDYTNDKREIPFIAFEEKWWSVKNMVKELINKLHTQK